jgi:hypothetical protein
LFDGIPLGLVSVVVSDQLVTKLLALISEIIRGGIGPGDRIGLRSVKSATGEAHYRKQNKDGAHL